MYRNRPIANSEYSDCLPTPGTAALAPRREAAAREATLLDRPQAAPMPSVPLGLTVAEMNYATPPNSRAAGALLRRLS